MIRAVIFDFNGVLIDDEQVHFELFREVLAEEGVELTEQLYHEKYLGYDDIRCFEAALLDAQLPAERATIDQMVVRKAGRYIPRAEAGLRYFPGAAECIRSLSDRWPIAVNSGALLPEIEFALRRMGVRDRVRAIISAEQTQACKPDPEGYLLALDALRSEMGDDLEAAHCLVFEDSLAGVQSAKSAGMWAVGVTNTYDDPSLRSAGADAIRRGLEGVTPGWIENLFKQEVSP
jgi:HAD superfamily hydrolase (TIGR01509 family)